MEDMVFGFDVRLHVESTESDIVFSARRMGQELYRVLEQGGWWMVKLNKHEEDDHLTVTVRVKRCDEVQVVMQSNLPNLPRLSFWERLRVLWTGRV